jgi:hypothetical protein
MGTLNADIWLKYLHLIFCVLDVCFSHMSCRGADEVKLKLPLAYLRKCKSASWLLIWRDIQWVRPN